ncbi:hypothetical protein A2U01_0087165, partial [Trifolium medium]|nr:hypothetical protein [Trifolium medium]
GECFALHVERSHANLLFLRSMMKIKKLCDLEKPPSGLEPSNLGISNLMVVLFGCGGGPGSGGGGNPGGGRRARS